MSFLGQFKAVNNPDFYGRVWMACYRTAEDVLNESVGEPNHAARADLAIRIEMDPEKWAKPLVWACAMNPTIGGTIDEDGVSTSPDGDIQYVVNSNWDRATVWATYIRP